MFDYGEAGAFDDYVDRLAGKLAQLDRSISDHQQGKFTIEDDPLTGDVPYLPILVVDEPFTWSPELRDLLESRHGASLFRHPSVAKQPVVCSISEYESLIHAVEQGRDLPRLITDYLGTQRSVPLELFLASASDVLDVPDLLKDGFSAMTQRWIQALRLPEE